MLGHNCTRKHNELISLLYLYADLRIQECYIGDSDITSIITVTNDFQSGEQLSVAFRTTQNTKLPRFTS